MFKLLGSSGMRVSRDKWEIIMKDGSLHQAKSLREAIEKVRTQHVAKDISLVREAASRCSPRFVEVWKSHERVLIAKRNQIVASC